VYVVAEDKAERERIRSSLAEDIAAATTPSGEPIAREVFRREELYDGSMVDRAPDIVFDQCPGVHTSEAMGQEKAMAEPDNWRGENVPDGMVLFAGDGVEPSRIDPIRISDIAPTLLHWMGQSVPEDMDGSPVLDIFADGSEAGSRPVETRESLGGPAESSRPDVGDDVEDRLEDIGYLE